MFFLKKDLEMTKALKKLILKACNSPAVAAATIS